ncbi:hypothetical protein FXF51_52430 [Nonomuraea sp. PA05]|uniref:hypothetical protein n=1 Tax=Nonomuraea sp. PA05 TaxID=2604466 RepID=UPI0011D9A50D|nr:hypothetical protein [Nonomuraea sp. PA05]TYB51986.1 hypothetical protein FXF51_52430 [Nonomuraea sp. PA05]
MKKVLAVVIAALALIAGGVPAAAAGGWAVTYLDPAPARFEEGKSYALGFWVLQHGTHPFEGKMEPVGLRLTAEGGQSLLFAGTALPEAAHYVASVVVPAGVWKVEGVQGPFAAYEVGTLTVPGGLRIKPVDPGLVDSVGESGQQYWGDVRPPGFPAGDEPVPSAPPAVSAAPTLSAPPAVAGAPAAPPVTAPPAVRTGDEGGGVPAYTLILAAAGGALLIWVVLGLPTRARRRREEEPDRPSEDTIVISG